jgi:hypothetical protein
MVKIYDDKMFDKFRLDSFIRYEKLFVQTGRSKVVKPVPGWMDELMAMDAKAILTITFSNTKIDGCFLN